MTFFCPQMLGKRSKAPLGTNTPLIYDVMSEQVYAKSHHYTICINSDVSRSDTCSKCETAHAWHSTYDIQTRILLDPGLDFFNIIFDDERAKGPLWFSHKSFSEWALKRRHLILMLSRVLRGFLNRLDTGHLCLYKGWQT